MSRSWAGSLLNPSDGQDPLPARTIFFAASRCGRFLRPQDDPSGRETSRDPQHGLHRMGRDPVAHRATDSAKRPTGSLGPWNRPSPQGWMPVSSQSAHIIWSQLRHRVRKTVFFFSARVSEGLHRTLFGINSRPGFLVAKGGITSSDIGVKRTMVLGQIQPGVPTWALGAERRLPGLPYVIFPGHAGDEWTLRRVVEIVRGGAVFWA